MEGFKNTTKIKYFKEGGFVTKKEFTAYEKKEDKAEESKDIKKDTQMIKKGVRQHESALHKGEPKTELKLKCGGRAKKETGTVKKYKTGGTVENAYGAKKSDKDIKDIANSKRQKPAMLCGGKSVKKMADGRLTGYMENDRKADRIKRAMKYLGPAQQAEFAAQESAPPVNPAPSMGPTPANPVPSAPVDQMGNMTGQKKGGKVAKKC